jgi:hypothetical protein
MGARAGQAADFVSIARLDQSRGADMLNHTGRLVLVPRDPNCALDRTALIHSLAAAGFLGPALTPDGDTFSVGDAFLHLVTFAGCAVHVEVTPGADPDRTFCHVRVAGPYPEPLLLVGRNTRPPRCPACRAPLRDWRNALGQMGTAAQALSCPACQTPSPACAWDWKETGGCVRVSLWVEEVFPGEAAPTDALMRLLAEAAGTPWRHFYIQD